MRHLKNIIHPKVSACMRSASYGFIVLLTVTQIAQASWLETAKLVGNDTLPGSWAGWGGKGVDISGDTIIFGAAQPNGVGTGEAYVFQKSSGGWMQIAELTADDGEVGEDFGYSVAIDGTTAVIGARNENSLGGGAGAAYVFEYDNFAWQQVAKLTASDGAFSDLFGNDVAIFGDTIVVGADHDRDQGHATGAAYVFQNTSSGWSETAKLIASDQAAGDGFGHSVAINAETILIGAGDEGNGEGSVYVFENNGLAWLEVDKLIASDPVGEAGRFGGALDIDGDRAVIGRDFSDESGASSGSAYVFEKTLAGWIETAKLTAIDLEAGDNFGISVGLDGDTIVVGAYHDDDIAANAGAAYMFEYEGDSWSEVSKLTASTLDSSALLGYSVAVHAGTAVVTALGDDEGGANAGAAFVYSREVPEPTSLLLATLGFWFLVLASSRHSSIRFGID